jgi:FAD/FMN-containing dehydrogenase
MNLMSELARVVGDTQFFIGAAIDDRYRLDLARRLHQQPLCVVRPKSTTEVAALLRIASAHGTPVTMQGGRTGAVDGSFAGADSILISLERMNAIEELDPVSMVMTVQAGLPLQAAQAAAEQAGLFLPLDIGARGSATVGGVISTNAGGLRTIRWGMTRDMVLGLEAVLADGTVVSGLKKTIKDNAGYDWKHLMIGSEGTLGVVTRATLRLRPKPRSVMTALVAVADFERVMALLRDLDADLGGQLASFEVMWAEFYIMVTEGNRAKRAPPMSSRHPFYLVVEAMGGDPEPDMAQFQAALGRALARGDAVDVVIAQSERERSEIWAVREDLAEPMMKLVPLFAFDVSVALRDMPRVAEEITSSIRADYPQATMLVYGHAGDGNLHFVIGVGDGSAETEHKIDLTVYRAIQRAGGSISAEHGIGLAKREYLGFTRSPEEIALMRMLKRALDPGNILNPGKVIDMTQGAAA